MSLINAVSFWKREKNPSHTQIGSWILGPFNYYRECSHLRPEIRYQYAILRETTTSDMCDKIKNNIITIRDSKGFWRPLDLSYDIQKIRSRIKHSLQKKQSGFKTIQIVRRFSSWTNERLHFNISHSRMNTFNVNPINLKANGYIRNFLRDKITSDSRKPHIV